MPINWRKKRQLRWPANCSVRALVLHTLIVGAVASIVAFKRNTNSHIVMLWAVLALLDFPSSLLAIMSSMFPRTAGLGASPRMLHAWLPAFSFGFFGGLQWFLVGRLFDKKRLYREGQPGPLCIVCGFEFSRLGGGACPKCGTRWPHRTVNLRTKNAASLALVVGLLLIPGPLAVAYFIDSLYTHGMGDNLLVFFMPTLLAWSLAAVLVIRGIYGLFAFPGKRVEGACEKCGYCLKGLTEPRCPECGTAFEPELLPGLGKDLSA